MINILIEYEKSLQSTQESIEAYLRSRDELTQIQIEELNGWINAFTHSSAQQAFGELSATLDAEKIESLDPTEYRMALNTLIRICERYDSIVLILNQLKIVFERMIKDSKNVQQAYLSYNFSS